MSRIDITQLDYESLGQTIESIRKVSTTIDDNLSRIREIFNILVSGNVFKTQIASEKMSETTTYALNQFSDYNGQLLEFAAFLDYNNATNQEMDEGIATEMNNAFDSINDAIDEI